jgi:serine/threonine protein kinase
MATKRKRNSSWEFVVRRKGLLPKPLYLTFTSEEEGDQYVKKLEALLDRGVVPDEFRRKRGDLVTIEDAAREYLAAQHVPFSDKRCLAIVVDRIGTTRLSAITYDWAESWVTALKRERNLSPTTIRHHVGSLARCFDWGARRGVGALVVNPLRQLPRRYAAYSDSDVTAVEVLEGNARVDVERDRRLQPDEELRIRATMAGEKPEERQRAFEVRWQGAFECLFELALESGMRMREMYTLSKDQISLAQRTIFLHKTKNGDKRQVPLTSVAIKVILGDQPDGEGRKRFLREAQAASALNHPNIVTVHEVGRDGDVDFIVMERIAGLTLRDTIGSSRLPPRTILEYAAQIAGALAAAHDAGLVHRDLKPGNIMVTPRGLVKVLDFGLALQTAPGESSTTATSQGVLSGTVSYMSPEQAQSKAVDSRSDIFAFGCVLYEMLTGRQAFHEENSIDTLAAILHDEPAPIDPNIAPRALWRLIAKCLRKHPDDRWQHMSDVKQLLEDLAKDDEPSASAPAGAKPQVSGRDRGFRWPALVAVGGATAVLVFVGLMTFEADYTALTRGTFFVAGP